MAESCLSQAKRVQHPRLLLALAPIPSARARCSTQTYTFEELGEAFSALIQQRHSEIRDAGKEITKLLSSSNRVLKVCARVWACGQEWHTTWKCAQVRAILLQACLPDWALAVACHGQVAGMQIAYPFAQPICYAMPLNLPRMLLRCLPACHLGLQGRAPVARVRGFLLQHCYRGLLQGHHLHHQPPAQPGRWACTHNGFIQCAGWR